ncbi:MAG TPA: radical SAM protein [Thermoplasmata archaeon]|nr:radical SAM protein [Thermoplasmata archaeon]
MEPAVVARAKPGETVLLSECYASIQGESTLVGTPTVFVRLYTCNLRCVWCDSMYAVEGGEFREMPVPDLVAEIRRLATARDSGRRRGISHVCWTGGEPLLQWKSIAPTIEILPDHFVHTFETDGEVDLGPFDRAMAAKRSAGLVRFIMDIKCPGSAMKAKKAFENLKLLQSDDEVKFVLLDRRDYEFAKEVLETRKIPTDAILFSPVTAAHEVARGLDPATLASWILEDRLDVRLQPQVHKFIWPGRERGI